MRIIHVFMRVSPGNIRSAGAKYHVIGFASTRGHEKQPAATDVKVSHIRGKTTDLATLSGGDVLPSLARALLPDPSRPACALSQFTNNSTLFSNFQFWGENPAANLLKV